MHASLEDATASLAATLRKLGGTVHVIAHSLGGVITLETFAAASDLPPGRIVLLGSPVQGSRAARSIGNWSFGPQLLGALAVAELCRPCERRWAQEREIGLIAGARSAGLGRLFCDLPQPNDGTICVEETQLPGATAHCVLDVSHTGMLFSMEVARNAVAFLATGRFPQHG